MRFEARVPSELAALGGFAGGNPALGLLIAARFGDTEPT
jgi:hypothetical protein